MPYELVWEEGGVYVRLFGIVTFEQVATANAEFYQGLENHPATYQLFDFLGVEALDVSAPQAEKIGRADRLCPTRRVPFKVAIVSTDPDFDRLHDQYLGALENTPWSGRKFATLAEARAWISA